jgi:hypothetical protein
MEKLLERNELLESALSRIANSKTGMNFNALRMQTIAMRALAAVQGEDDE